jgi:hypothetical protein
MKRVSLKIGLLVVLAVLLIFLWFGHSPLPLPLEGFDSYILPKHVWIYWDSDTMPPLIERIYRYNSTNLVGWKITLLHNSTLGQYIPSFPTNYNSLGIQQKSDWIRLYLLKNYGGLWMDASTIINDGSAVDALYNESVQKKSQLTAFTYREKPDDIIPKNIESWFLMAPKNSIVIEDWYNEFTLAINIGFDKYIEMLNREKVDLRSIDPGTYLTLSMALQKTLQKNIDTPPMVFRSGVESMFKLHNDCKKIDASREYICVMNKMKNKEGKKLPYIKLTHYDRDTGIDIMNYFDSN